MNTYYVNDIPISWLSLECDGIINIIKIYYCLMIDSSPKFTPPPNGLTPLSRRCWCPEYAIHLLIKQDDKLIIIIGKLYTYNQY